MGRTGVGSGGQGGQHGQRQWLPGFGVGETKGSRGAGEQDDRGATPSIFMHFDASCVAATWVRGISMIGYYDFSRGANYNDLQHI